jgi:hypothetical protein
VEADWIDPKTRRYLDTPKWEAETLRCFGCAEMETAQKDIPAGEKGVRVVLVPWSDDDDAGEEEGGAFG